MIPMVETAPYGSWRSPVTADLTASSSVRIGDVQLVGGRVYWSEMRPDEKGRCVVVEYSDAGIRDRTPAGFNARTTVHEYGGGAYTVVDGAVYFSNFMDQLLYRCGDGGAPVKVTLNPDQRHADYIHDPWRRRVICVREDHGDSSREAVNSLVAVSVKDGSSVTLAGGNDFYSNPRLSPDGDRLAFLTWSHPNMPWDGCELWVAEVMRDGTLGGMKLVVGGPEESVVQPEWGPDGVLYFVSDRGGWWNLYRWREGAVEGVCPMEAEFGGPSWVFGLTYYGFDGSGSIVAVYSKDGFSHLARIDADGGSLEEMETPYTDISYLKVGDGCAVFVGGSYKTAPEVVRLDLNGGEARVLRRSDETVVDEGYLSTPEPVEYPTEGGLTAHAIYYPPTNRDYVPPDGELPPLMVKVHGGPTSAVTTTLNWGIQFWTSRGFALVDVNYGGSTGYGREYMRRLVGNWGVVDVDDSVNAAKYLVGEGLADPDRTAIRGGSAGGYTTLSTLAFRDYFRAGASYYGISDLEVFAGDTHKYESRYLFSLVGPYPERRDLYRDRSAINHLDGINVPMIVFQGLEDKVVPPNQAELIVEALREKGLPVAYIGFEGEQHGFRMAGNIRRSLEAELYFYSRMFGFTPADEIEPVHIENME
jgi:dipeptidyl aminopeptidase/acylaminoacyl peptidase